MSKRPALFLIDGSSYMYRAFFAIPHLSNSSGLPTNAIYGFTTMLQKIISVYKPDYLALVFDTPAPTFRHEVYEDYKANRPEMPDTLSAQIPYIKEVVKGFNIALLEKEGFEADDIIGTIAKKEETKDLEIVIASGDKDLLQLVNEHITVIDTMKDKRFDKKGVVDYLGIEPRKVTDFLGLVGDSSDNVPGVPGIGKKTALKLLEEYDTIHDVLKHPESITSKKIKENLIKFADQALLSKQLVTLDTEVAIEYELEELKATYPDREKLKVIFKELEFTKLLQGLTAQDSPEPHAAYHLVSTKKSFAELLSHLGDAQVCAISLITATPDPLASKPAGIAFAYSTEQVFYVPLTDTAPRNTSFSREWAMKQLKPIMEDEGIKKYGHDIKQEIIALKQCGITLKGITCDTMLASYLLNPSRHSHSLEEIALEYFDHKMTLYKELVGTGKKEIPFDQVETDQAMTYACERAHFIMKATTCLQEQLSEEGFDQLFYEVELPLLEVLASMEMSGVKVDTDRLHAISQEFQDVLSTFTEKIYQLAGETFNINSPQQLGKILFEKLQLPGAKKTKTGFSTDVAVLTKLAQTHPLPAEVLGYRSISKLKSTYVDALPNLVNSATGRIHTSYNQTVTATGRLSSSNPNLQNIPIRTAEGRKIREAFIAETGCTVLSADYSQIELRILAHLSQDSLLLESFKQNEDIHTRTAAEIFGLMPNLVTEQMRREAKVINFGIIYGMSSFGLAKELGISPKAAGAFIENYFQKYKGVKTYLDRILKQAKKQHYVTTLMKRRRYIPEINSKNMTVRQFAERTAINAPIQGTAADLIKVAMLSISKRVAKEKLKAKMIMQVHDELVFEVPEKELEPVAKMVKEEMENVMELSIPLKVEIHWGKTWNEAH
ncbi:MAG: DNA polymerase I [Thermodesulfobacteriota bacterium]|nr:DNA polymerase I [Thermodesulfobacteriota bacterium]